MIEEQNPKVRKIYSASWCVICKTKRRIIKFYYDHCSVDCVKEIREHGPILVTLLTKKTN